MTGRLRRYSKIKDFGMAGLESSVGKLAVCMGNKGLRFEVIGRDSQ